ncbi:hypothetical protein [Psittacicella hinzii]|uniref:Uncharacterized protein n=1 Tax=Psittacicella hinzii TaxID=2028575 RepID=A0A3A1YTH9_9GAMM|nr:hypothetical protein [Psittacicella hinzii]RIY40806.1 hypothetical protein CKF58_00165 [Psittacicella hinzii]
MSEQHPFLSADTFANQNLQMYVQQFPGVCAINFLQVSQCGDYKSSAPCNWLFLKSPTVNEVNIAEHKVSLYLTFQLLNALFKIIETGDYNEETTYFLHQSAIAYTQLYQHLPTNSMFEAKLSELKPYGFRDIEFLQFLLQPTEQQSLYEPDHYLPPHAVLHSLLLSVAKYKFICNDFCQILYRATVNYLMQQTFLGVGIAIDLAIHAYFYCPQAYKELNTCSFTLQQTNKIIEVLKPHLEQSFIQQGANNQHYLELAADFMFSCSSLREYVHYNTRQIKHMSSELQATLQEIFPDRQAVLEQMLSQQAAAQTTQVVFDQQLCLSYPHNLNDL